MFGFDGKAREKEALELQKKKHIEDPKIIAQFSTKCGDSIYDCDCDIYAYRDSFSIRKRGVNVVGQSNDRVLFDEVKMLWIGNPSTPISPGIINIAYEEGSRYSGYKLPNYKEKKYTRTIGPNEIYFDWNYNTYVAKGLRKINQAIRTYKQEKEQREQERTASTVYNFNGAFYVKDGSINFGDISISVDNSVNKTILDITNEIYQKGGEDREELFIILLEVQNMLKEMQKSRIVPEKKNLFQKIVTHADKHGWFYAEIISLIGTAIMQLCTGV